MTEHDLTSLLHDHLADEPPLSHTGPDAIRTAKRQIASRRALAVGAGALAVVAVTALGVGVNAALVDDEPTTAVAQEPAMPLTQQMEAVAANGFTPYVGTLGEPDWSINALLGEPVPEGDPAAQTYQLSYHPSGETVQVNLSVGGYAPSDFETYDFASSCEMTKAQGLTAYCETTTLEDGSLLTVEIAPRARIGTDAPRMITVDEATSRPEGTVSWMRVVSLSTLDGMAVDASEYVRADDPESADWQVPVATLRALVLDTDLRDADVAHEPMPLYTDE